MLLPGFRHAQATSLLLNRSKRKRNGNGNGGGCLRVCILILFVFGIGMTMYYVGVNSVDTSSVSSSSNIVGVHIVQDVSLDNLVTIEPRQVKIVKSRPKPKPKPIPNLRRFDTKKTISTPAQNNISALNKITKTVVTTKRVSTTSPKTMPSFQSTKNGGAEFHSSKPQSHTRRGTRKSQLKPFESTILVAAPADSSGILNWNHQWPIGNGRIGAMVGGTIDAEVVPFSIAKLYQSVDESQDNSMKFAAFREARQRLLEANIAEATKKAIEMQSRTSYGTFQYMADMAIFSSSTAFAQSESGSLPVTPAKEPPRYMI